MGEGRSCHINVTRHPTADWVVQQLREAFPEPGPYRYVILDRDSKFDADVIAFLKATGLKPKRTSAQAPWQNPYAERLIGSIRRDCLNHFVILNSRHLKRTLASYFAYYHGSRTHLELDKECPLPRQVSREGRMVEIPQLGGLHHRYERVAA